MELVTINHYKNKKVMAGKDHEDIILLLPSECGNGLDEMVYPVETYDLIKFAELEKPELTIVMIEESNNLDTLVLHSDEFWLPIFKVLGTISLSVIANFVTDFIKFKCGNHCDLGSKTVHFKVVNSDKKSGQEQEISYDGPADKATEMFEKIDINRIMEEK